NFPPGEGEGSDLICPTGKSAGQFIDPPVQPLSKKYSDFPKTQITLYPPPFRPPEGRFAIVTDVGRNAVDAGGAKDESAGSAFAEASADWHLARRSLWRRRVADGEVVWFWRPDAGVKSVEAIPPATVARKPGHRGELEVSRK